MRWAGYWVLPVLIVSFLAHKDCCDAFGLVSVRFFVGPSTYNYSWTRT
jgi:hypothetical protein